jgi:hypothetical protein
MLLVRIHPMESEMLPICHAPAPPMKLLTRRVARFNDPKLLFRRPAPPTRRF